MNQKMNVKIFFKISLIIAIIFTLIIPGIADINKEETNQAYKNIIEGKLEQKPTENLLKNIAGNDILVSPYFGDDQLPSITEDSNGHTIVTWTNEQNITETNWGIAYSENPTNQTSWLSAENNSVLLLQDISNGINWDTAFIKGGDSDFIGLAGSFISKTEGIHGFYIIKDITTDPIENMGTDWLFWQMDDHPNVYNSEIADGPSFINKNNPTYEPGPFVLYIFTYTKDDLVLNQTPVFTQMLLEDLEIGSIGIAYYFDAQENEKTIPADNPDYCALINEYHTVIQNIDEEKIIWKKVVPAEEPDYEFTPYQKTIADGTHPCIAADNNNIVVLYVQDGELKSAYSTDDGETFNTESILTGNYPEICVINGIFYAAFIENNNLFIIKSEDGGINWSEPHQINDVDGTVVDEAGSADIHKSGFIVWTDNRAIDLDLYLDEFINIPKPKINIEQISEGIGISAYITNNGDINASNVNWNINLDGFVLLGRKTSYIIPNLAIGESVEIKSGIPFGFGSIKISIYAESAEGPSDSVISSGKLYLFYIAVLD
jgi:hypothetical protein